MDNQKYKTGFKRFLAAIVDGIVFIPLVLLERLIFEKTQNSFVIFAWLTLSALLPIIYSIFLHYKYGQTIGKWVVGVKVIDMVRLHLMTYIDLESFLRSPKKALIKMFGKSKQYNHNQLLLIT